MSFIRRLGICVLLFSMLATVVTARERKVLPPSVVNLDDESFNSLVFPQGSDFQDPWVIIFFTSWCSHCKKFIPLLINVSQTIQLPRSRIGLVNAGSGKLAARFGVSQYPDVYYTTTRSKTLYPYTGSTSPFSVLQFSTRLLASQRTSSFANNISDLHFFADEEEKLQEPSVIFFGNALDKQFLDVVDASAGYGHGTAYLMDNTALHEASAAPELYQKLANAGQDCLKRHPDASFVALSTSDNYDNPPCFSGPWLDEGTTAKSGILHPTYITYLRQTQRRALELFDPSFFSTLDNEHGNYVGFIAVNNPRQDVNYLPAFRSTVRKLNQQRISVSGEGPASRIIWTAVDAQQYHGLLSYYDVSADSLPQVLVVDVSRNRFFRIDDHSHTFETEKKAIPWAFGDVPTSILENFSLGVLNGAYKARTKGFLGLAVQNLCLLPGMDWVHAQLYYDDLAFVVSVCAAFVCLLVAVCLSLFVYRSSSTTNQKKRQ